MRGCLLCLLTSCSNYPCRPEGTFQLLSELVISDECSPCAKEISVLDVFFLFFLMNTSFYRVLPDMEVLDVDVLVRSRLPLAPQQEAFFG